MKLECMLDKEKEYYISLVNNLMLFDINNFTIHNSTINIYYDYNDFSSVLQLLHQYIVMQNFKVKYIDTNEYELLLKHDKFEIEVHFTPFYTIDITTKKLADEFLELIAELGYNLIATIKKQES